MSTENAVLFLAKMNHDATLTRKVMDGSATAAAWVAAAGAAGFPVTLDELRSVAEQIAGRPIKAENLVGELRAMFEGTSPTTRIDGAIITGAALSSRLTALGAASGIHVKEAGPIFASSSQTFNPGKSSGRCAPGSAAAIGSRTT
jgi:predicted ribosomally synthesized peptide with nif11-like leader